MDAFSQGKWNFYSFCNQHPELKAYIPKTNIPTLSGLESFDIKELNITPLFKPADSSLGIGIQLFSSEDMKDFDTLRKKLNTCLITREKEEIKVCNDFYPFVLQEFLGNDIEDYSNLRIGCI